MAKAKFPTKTEAAPTEPNADEQAAAKLLEESRNRRIQQCQSEVAAVLEKHDCDLFAVPRIHNGVIVADCFIQAK